MTDVGSAVTMCEAFQATAARYAQQVALRTPGGAVALTWEQYASRVRAIAAGLARLGVSRGDTVALMMTNRPEFHQVDAAAFHLGAAPFSVYNTLAAEQIIEVLSNAGSRVVVSEEQFARRLLAVRDATPVEHVVCVDGGPDGTLTLEELAAGGAPGFGFDAGWRAVEPGDLLTLVYTSGTTGPPKGVQITHAQMLAELRATEALLPVSHGDRVISYLPMAHAIERYSSHYKAIFSGLQVTTLADAKDLPAALRDVRPTLFGGVPRVWEKLKAGVEAMASHEPDQAMKQALETAQQYVRADGAGDAPAHLAEAYRRADEQVLSKIRVALGLDQVQVAPCGGAPIAPDVLTFMLALGIRISEAWGMSEATCIVTYNPPDAMRTGTAGRAIPGVQLRLADDGELLVRGPIVTKGYYHDPVRTAEAIDPEGWLHTGDIGTIDDEGYVTITGRKKELIINAAGKNMSPANIEGAVLGASPLIAQAVAIGDRRSYNVALIVLDPDAAAQFAIRQGITDPAPAILAGHIAVRAAVAAAVDAGNRRLSQVEQIKRFAIVPAFWQPGGEEITPTMKLKRQAITVKYADLIESLYSATGQPA